METKPDWQQHVKTLLPLSIAGALVATPFLGMHLSDHAHMIQSLSGLLLGLQGNLLASGLSAFCKPSRFRIAAEYPQTLANHEIRSLIRTAWGEAAAASVHAYVKMARAQQALTSAVSFPSVTKVPRSTAFLETLEGMKASDFVDKQEVTVRTIQLAVEASRRALLPAEEGTTDAATEAPATPIRSPEIEKKAQAVVKELSDELIKSVLAPIQNKLGKERIPDDFRLSLEAGNPELKGGILGQLCIYVAFYLKTQPRAQTAVLHFTLQEISDQQIDMRETAKRIEELCGKISQDQSTMQQEMLAAYETKLRCSLDQALNRFVQPQLEAPFDRRHPGERPGFTYRDQATGFVGREEAMSALVEFMGDARPALWTVISGPAGSGKNRLAGELISKVCNSAPNNEKGVPPGQWRAGFLRGAWIEGDMEKWSPDADTLIVLDYAGSRESGLTTRS